MATRYNDFNSNSEERLLMGKECLSSKPIALAFPAPERKSLFVRQMEQLDKIHADLASQGVEESDKDFFDFDMPDEQDFADNYSYFEQIAQKFEAYQAAEAAKAAAHSGLTTEVVPNTGEAPQAPSSAPHGSQAPNE